MPSPRDFPNPGIEPRSPTLQVDSLPSEPPGKLGGYYKLLILSLRGGGGGLDKLDIDCTRQFYRCPLSK